MVNETAAGRLIDRWPTAVGLVAAAGTIVGILNGAGENLGPGVAAMMAIYTATWAIGRPVAAFWVFAALIVIAALAVVLDLEGAIVMVVVLGVTWVWALLTRRTEDSRWLTIETLGVVFFGGLTIAAFVADARLGLVLAGVGWFTHGLWDAYHFVKDRIVSRTWSELCAVVDIPVGTALIVAGLLG